MVQGTENEMKYHDNPWWMNNSQDPQIRTQWVLIDPCGCAQGVLEGTEAPGPIQAMEEFYDSTEELEAALKAGVTIRQMTHAEYHYSYADHLDTDWQCPHRPALSFWERVWSYVRGRGW